MNAPMKLACLVMIASLPAAAHAQCVGEWTRYTGNSGLTLPALAIAELSNADLVIGGQFFFAGPTQLNYVGRWNGSAWSAIGGGMNNRVTALASLPSGAFVAGGDFTMAGTTPAPRIAIWNNASWVGLGNGLNSTVQAIAAQAANDIFAGGGFTAAISGPTLNGIGHWDGTQWTALGTGLQLANGNPGAAYALRSTPQGLLVAGFFERAGGVVVKHVARWTGSAWQPVGVGATGINASAISALAVMPNGDIVAGGVQSTAPIPAIFRWNGTSWNALGPGLFGANASVFALETLPGGDLVAGGSFTTDGGQQVFSSLLRWNGASWSELTPLGQGFVNPSVAALKATSSGDLVLAGSFGTAGGLASQYWARWREVCAPTCDSIDFNNDGSSFDPTDIDAFLSVFSEGPCIPAGAICNDVDFNNDGSLFDPCDVDSFLLVFSEGPCTPCGG